MDDDVVGGYVPPENPSLLPDVIRRRPIFTRRRFLTVGGGAAAGVALDAHTAHAAPTSVADALRRALSAVQTILARRATIAPSGGRSSAFSIYRREDMLRLGVEFYNLEATSSDKNKFTRTNTKKPAYVVFKFPAQHIAEEALLRPDSAAGREDFGDSSLARARIAGPSQLVFEVPNFLLPITKSVDGLLSWLRWLPYLAPVALPDGTQSGPTLKAPTTNTPTAPGATALELPWRLILSPLPNGMWVHRNQPAPANGIYELWHTRLANKKITPGGVIDTISADEFSFQRQVRAIWSKDPGYAPTKKAPMGDEYDDDDHGLSQGSHAGDGDQDGEVFEPFRAALSPRNRMQIVQNSSKYGPTTNGQGHTKPIDVNRLMLSALGGFLDVEGDWDDPRSDDLIFWRHRATLGRDQFVKTIERGFFMPWGLPAVRIKITERVVENRDYTGQPDGKLNVAFLQQKLYYVIRNPRLQFPVTGQQNDGRGLPFKALRSRTIITPALSGEDLNLVPGARVPMFGAKPTGGLDTFKFDFEATDWEGHKVRFHEPMAFVNHSDATPTPLVGSFIDERAQLRSNWNNSSDEMRLVQINGQTVSFAAADEAGDTALETHSMRINVQSVTPSFVDQAMWAPALANAMVRLESAEQVSGGSLGAVEVHYPQRYINVGFGGTNPAKTFLELPTPPAVDFGQATDNSGGVVAPSLSITAVSRAKGAIGGTTQQHNSNSFDPVSVFGALDANLIGGLKLKDVIAPATNAAGMELKTVELADGKRATLRWQPTLQPDPLGILVVHNNTSFVLDAAYTRKNDGTSTSEIRGDLRNVTLQLLGSSSLLHFIDVDIKRLIFTAKSGTSPHVDVGLGDVRFAGPLTFINELRKVLQNPDGPVGVDVNGSGIKARATLAVPSIGVGIFNLSNLAFSSEIGIPFDNNPVYADFRISSKDDPFLVAVSMFGGGGWFGMTVDSEGIKKIEAGFEFGATVSVDFGPVGGSIEVMAGIYFSLEDLPANGKKITLTGYVRFHGEVHVGFVSVGLVAELDLSYVSKNGKAIVTGRAEVTLEIPVAPDISFEIERSFGGDPHDPRFVDQINPGEWRAYVDAFADEPMAGAIA